MAEAETEAEEALIFLSLKSSQTIPGMSKGHGSYESTESNKSCRGFDDDADVEAEEATAVDATAEAEVVFGFLLRRSEKEEVFFEAGEEAEEEGLALLFDGVAEVFGW